MPPDVACRPGGVLIYAMQSIRFAAKFEFLDEIREFVGNIARNGGFGDKDVYNIQLATDEAASNIIEHAYEGISDGVLDLSCGMIETDTIKIVLVDYGYPFDPSTIPMPDLKADLSARKIGGLGIFLMRKLMDEVHYEPRPDKSNVLSMTKRKK
jgi:anti-sigma regulatory factor (Ser/Thr protein kinase)